MSLYNMLFGVNDCAGALLLSLGLDHNDVPRFRDCFLQGLEIVIHTRTGGGNRLYYESLASCQEEYPEYFLDAEPPTGPWNDDLRKHPCYLRDEDDSYDCTYANFYFSFPKEFEEKLMLLAKDNQTPMPSERWKKVLGSVE